MTSHYCILAAFFFLISFGSGLSQSSDLNAIVSSLNKAIESEQLDSAEFSNALNLIFDFDFDTKTISRVRDISIHYCQQGWGYESNEIDETIFYNLNYAGKYEEAIAFATSVISANESAETITE